MKPAIKENMEVTQFAAHELRFTLLFQPGTNPLKRSLYEADKYRVWGAMSLADLIQEFKDEWPRRDCSNG